MSIKINFNIKNNNENIKYHTNLQKSISNTCGYENIFENVINDKIINPTGVSLISKDVNKIILPQGKIGIFKEVILSFSNTNDVLLYYNNDYIVLNINRKYIRFIWYNDLWYIVE